MRSYRFLTALVVGLLFLSACTASRPYVARTFDGWERQAPATDQAPAYRVFLIGDAGGTTADDPVLRLLRSRLADAGDDAAVVFLGDNIYCCGLPDSGTVKRDQAVQRLEAQLQAVEDFPGRIVFIPGNHDWNNGQAGGRDALARQEAYVEAYLDRGNTFLPDNGFPGPVDIELADGLTLIALDTQWWLHEYEKSFGDTGEYDLEEDANFLLELDDVIKRKDDDVLLVVGHHPLRSNGFHAGVLPLSDHLFPLRNVHPALVVPLPVIGSLYPLAIRYGGGRQDLSHPRYRALRNALAEVFGQHEDLIYAAGHEHTLQYFPVAPAGHNLRQHFIVSGAGSRPKPVGRGRDAAFTAGNVGGFTVLDYYADGSTWLEMWTPEGNGDDGRLLFRSQLKGPSRDRIQPAAATTEDIPSFTDSMVTQAVNPDYEAGAVKEFFLGSHHRDAWATPVGVPVLDIGAVDGGLEVVKRGGGQQTISLRLENDEGRQYVIRSLDKDPSGTVPVNLQGTFITDIVMDQTASIHPFGAFIIPRLADAAGVYHTNPRPFHIPSDPRLGIYREAFAGQVMMLEERPDDDMSHAPSFGNSSDVVSAPRLYREITDDNDHRVDVRAFARVRLFDMWLSDWDRHKDQWRWASFEPYELDPSLTGDARTEGKIYRPIPRDRDWAFNRMNGLFPSLASIFDPKFQDFTESYGYLKGLNLNGLPQDRRFVSPLERSDWVEIARSLQAALTDDVIDAAVRDWPDAIYDLDGTKTARILKIRRDKLVEVAEAFYEIHAHVSDVVGSNKHERFEVTRLDDDSTRVVVYKTNKDGDVRRELFRRTYLTDETREIRLFGFDGNDTFIFEGDVQDGILVRAIGGAGDDTFTDRSRVRGPRKKTHVYDTASGTNWETGTETRVTASDDDPAVNHYNPNEYHYDARMPLVFFGNTKDDGLFIGGGMRFIRRGFRKQPYATSHAIKANLSAKTLAFNIVYNGHYIRAVGDWDVLFDVEYLSPNTIRNFYGLGNTTTNEAEDRQFYQARLTQLRVAPSLLRHLEEGLTFRIGPSLRVTDVDESSERFVNQLQAGITERTFSTQTFGSVESELIFDTRDNAVNPKQGLRWSNLAEVNVGLDNTDDTFVRIASDLALFVSPSLTAPQVTLAGRVGVSHNVSDFPFYAANTLGGTSNLRGYRSTRYAGRTAFYQNVELRLSLFQFSTYLALGRAGLLGFFDNGRVWTEADDDAGVAQGFFEGYHQGYGGGIWAELFNTVVISAVAGFSEDDTAVTLQLGFQF